MHASDTATTPNGHQTAVVACNRVITHLSFFYEMKNIKHNTSVLTACLEPHLHFWTIARASGGWSGAVSIHDNVYSGFTTNKKAWLLFANTILLNMKGLYFSHDSRFECRIIDAQVLGHLALLVRVQHDVAIDFDYLYQEWWDGTTEV